MQPTDGKLAHNLPSKRIGKLLGQRITLDRALLINVSGTHGRNPLCPTLPPEQVNAASWGLFLKSHGQLAISSWSCGSGTFAKAIRAIKNGNTASFARVPTR
jgi:hypothetical protein